MASSWIESRATKQDGPCKGRPRYRVMFRVRGAGSRRYFAGSFSTRAEALQRKRWVDGEIASMRFPAIATLEPPERTVRTLRMIAEEWQASRRDVAEGTRQTHRVNLARILPTLETRDVDGITVADVNELVGTLQERELARESLRKTLATFAMVLDYAKVVPNPARDRDVRLPREDREEVCPPVAAHVEGAHRVLTDALALATIVLDQTGMRVGEFEALTWGDVDEPESRWRVRAAASKTRRARWVPVPALVFGAVVGRVPREDRDLGGQVFSGFGADRYRTALARACKTAGVPAISPHDLRHRRATLWHLSGVPVAEAAAWLGHSPQEHLRTYAHAALVDRREIAVATLLSARRVPPSVPPLKASRVLEPA